MSSSTKVTLQPETARSHKKVGSMYEAHRLDGKAKNMGIKNLGKQTRKGKRGNK